MGDLEGNLTAERQQFRVRVGQNEAHAFYRQAEEKRLSVLEQAVATFANKAVELVEQPSNLARREMIEDELRTLRQAVLQHGQEIRTQPVWPGTGAHPTKMNFILIIRVNFKVCDSG